MSRTCEEAMSKFVYKEHKKSLNHVYYQLNYCSITLAMLSITLRGLIVYHVYQYQIHSLM